MSYSHHLFVCTGPTCSQQGAEETLQILQDSLWNRRLRNKMRVTLCRCLGQCGNGPNMVIYPEGTWYGGLTGEEIERIVQEHLIEGKVVPHLVQLPTD
ncbi:MAG TPA: (2Fe-2S) ferredoxin domain-containing protein [Candidatus Manganitrophaceae bacterium]|nr:(2Fe-2S) ferredoxin domain-containing protein [Candidatus Manganitrophaceae bacterium]